MHRVCRTSQRNAEGAFDCGASADMSDACRGAARTALDLRRAVREVEAKCAALLQNFGLGELVRTYTLHWAGVTRLDTLEAELARLENFGLLWHAFSLFASRCLPFIFGCVGRSPRTLGATLRSRMLLSEEAPPAVVGPLLQEDVLPVEVQDRVAR